MKKKRQQKVKEGKTLASQTQVKFKSKEDLDWEFQVKLWNFYMNECSLRNMLPPDAFERSIDKWLKEDEHWLNGPRYDDINSNPSRRQTPKGDVDNVELINKFVYGRDTEV